MIKIALQGLTDNGSITTRSAVIYLFRQKHLSIRSAILLQGAITINRAELMACIEAFKIIQKDPDASKIDFVCIHTDSQYIINNYQKVVWNS